MENAIGTADLENRIAAIFRKAGLADGQAAAMARNLAAAERDGCKSHGIYRIEGCLKTVLAGKADPLAVPQLHDDGGGVIRVAAKGGFSSWAFSRGAPLLAERAKRLGVAALVINDCVHLTALWPEIEDLTADGVAAMADAGTVAVLLPGAFYTLHETQMPPVKALREHRVPIALATDANPGSSPLTSLLLTMNMGCTLFRLTPEEALRGVTANAAGALGLSDVGTIAAGQRAELAVWDIAHPAELSYRIGFNPLHTRIRNGQ